MNEISTCACGHAKRPDMRRCLNCVECGRASPPAQTGERMAWLVVGDGEGAFDTRVCFTHADIVQFLWEQCGPNYTGKEDDTRNEWFAYLEDGDHWESRDGELQFRCEFDVGETGRITIQRMRWPAALTHSPGHSFLICSTNAECLSAQRR